jgi:hypothetical protein
VGWDGIGTGSERGRGRGGLVCRFALPPRLRCFTAGELVVGASAAAWGAAGGVLVVDDGLRGLLDRVLGPLPLLSSDCAPFACVPFLLPSDGAAVVGLAAARDLARGEAGVAALTWRPCAGCDERSAVLEDVGAECLGGRLMIPGVWAGARDCGCWVEELGMGRGRAWEGEAVRALAFFGGERVDMVRCRPGAEAVLEWLRMADEEPKSSRVRS